MKPHQQRVVEEKNELDNKILKLNRFFSNDMFFNLDINEQVRMKYQAKVMQDYSRILGERIEAFV